VDDVDAEYKRLGALGIANGTAPTDKPWGVRSFIINDPAGNFASFTKALLNRAHTEFLPIR
jgi:uncharacterized glyoxalase superfamily protein PhnB